MKRLRYREGESRKELYRKTEKIRRSERGKKTERERNRE